MFNLWHLRNKKTSKQKTATTLACLAPLLLVQILGIGAGWAPTKTVRKNIKLYRSVGEYILLMEEILYPLICSLSRYLQGLYVPGGAGFLPSTVAVFCSSFPSHFSLFAFLFIWHFLLKEFSYQERNGMEVKSSILDNPVNRGRYYVMFWLRSEYNNDTCFRIYRIKGAVCLFSI